MVQIISLASVDFTVPQMLEEIVVERVRHFTTEQIVDVSTPQVVDRVEMSQIISQAGADVTVRQLLEEIVVHIHEPS